MSLFQGLLAATTLLASVAIWLSLRSNWREYVPSRGRKRAEAAGGRFAVIHLSARGDFRVSRGAIALLGGFSGRRNLKTLLSRFKSDHANSRMLLGAAIDRLLAEGESFAMQAETVAHRKLQVIGEPRGAEVAIVLFDVTKMARRLEEVEHDVEAQRESAIHSERALATAGVASVVIRDDGEILDQSRLFREFSPQMQHEVTTEAAQRARLDEPREDDTMEVEGATYRLNVRRLGAAEILATVRKRSEAPSGEAAFVRFVNTMSETFAHLKVGLMIFDKQQRLTLFNPATATIFSADPVWLAGRPSIREMLDHMRETRTLPEQTDYPAWRDDLIDRLADPNGQEYAENWHLTDGRTILLTARPHASGGLAVTAEDVSESLALQRHSATESAVLRATTGFLEEALIVFGPDGMSRVVNEAFLIFWAFPPGSFAKPMHVSDVVKHCGPRTEDPDFWSMIRDRVTAGGGGGMARRRLELKSSRILSARASAMPDGSCLLVMDDITASERVATALRDRNEALEHADEIRGALVDQISHQMRTPLNAVFGFGQLLADGRFGGLNDRQRDYVDGIVSASQELLDAINGMADLISIGSDGMSLEGEILDPRQTLEEVVETAAIRMHGRDNRIEIGEAKRLGLFRAHRVRLRHIMFNLLMDCAAKAPRNERITVDMKLDERVLIIQCAHVPIPEVSDQGLSVSLVRRFTRLHNGDLAIEYGDNDQRILTVRLPECAPETRSKPSLGPGVQDARSAEGGSAR